MKSIKIKRNPFERSAEGAKPVGSRMAPRKACPPPKGPKTLCRRIESIKSLIKHIYKKKGSAAICGVRVLMLCSHCFVAQMCVFHPACHTILVFTWHCFFLCFVLLSLLLLPCVMSIHHCIDFSSWVCHVLFCCTFSVVCYVPRCFEHSYWVL